MRMSLWPTSIAMFSSAPWMTAPVIGSTRVAGCCLRLERSMSFIGHPCDPENVGDGGVGSVPIVFAMLRLRVAACRCGLPFWVDKAAPLAGQGAASSAARIEKATVKAVCALSCTIAGMRIPRAGVLSRRGLPIMAHGLRHPHACGDHGGIRHLLQSLFAAGAIAQAVARIQRQRRRDQHI